MSRTITPNPGFSQQLSIDLVPESQGAASPPEPVALKKARVPSAGQRLVRIEPRPFTMGAPRREPGRRANERERDVGMTRPFLIGEKPVTNGDYKKFDSSHDSGAVNGFSLGVDIQPVVNLTWNQAVEYLNWLSMQDDLPPFYAKAGDTYEPVSPRTNGYRLPTEAEWAYTARQAAGRQNQRYPWPGGFPPRSVIANLADESARNILARVISGYDDGFGVTAPVGSFPADKAGLYDIAGNVSEWCHDYYSAYTAGLSTAPDPLGPPTGTHRVIRGSSWKDASLAETRLSYRAYHKEARNNVGFRIARYP
ncbi:MAG: SUMF1/EgtB/PvdO family nonheme iron enzyme [Desulfofustis sp.]